MLLVPIGLSALTLILALSRLKTMPPVMRLMAWVSFAMVVFCVFQVRNFRLLLIPTAFLLVWICASSPAEKRLRPILFVFIGTALIQVLLSRVSAQDNRRFDYIVTADCAEADLSAFSTLMPGRIAAPEKLGRRFLGRKSRHKSPTSFAF